MRFLRRRKSNDLTFLVTRFAVGSLFLWFGMDKWIHHQAWVGWLDARAWEAIPLSPGIVIILVGAFEFVVGALLVAGLALRPVAVVAGISLAVGMVLGGVNEAAVRDAVVLGCSLAVFIQADDRASRKLPRRWVRTVVTGYVLVLFLVGILFLGNHGKLL